MTDKSHYIFWVIIVTLYHFLMILKFNIFHWSDTTATKNFMNKELPFKPINPFVDEEVPRNYTERISALESTRMPTVTSCRYLNIFAACSTCQHAVAISLASCFFNKDQKVSSSDYWLFVNVQNQHFRPLEYSHAQRIYSLLSVKGLSE